MFTTLRLRAFSMLASLLLLTGCATSSVQSFPDKGCMIDEDGMIKIAENDLVFNMPDAPGKLEALQKQMRYPSEAKTAGIEGTVFVKFVVNEDGQVISHRITQGLGYGCDEEALRAVETAAFTPARCGEVPAKMIFGVSLRCQDR